MFTLTLIQKEPGVRYKRIMVVPKTIDVWGTLGMQNRLIPDNSLGALYVSGKEIDLRDYLLFSRLHAPGKIFK